MVELSLDLIKTSVDKWCTFALNKALTKWFERYLDFYQNKPRQNGLKCPQLSNATAWAISRNDTMVNVMKEIAVLSINHAVQAGATRKLTVSEVPKNCIFQL